MTLMAWGRNYWPCTQLFHTWKFMGSFSHTHGKEELSLGTRLLQYYCPNFLMPKYHFKLEEVKSHFLVYRVSEICGQGEGKQVQSWVMSRVHMHMYDLIMQVETKLPVWSPRLVSTLLVPWTKHTHQTRNKIMCTHKVLYWIPDTRYQNSQRKWL